MDKTPVEMTVATMEGLMPMVKAAQSYRDSMDESDVRYEVAFQLAQDLERAYDEVRRTHWLAIELD